MEMGHERREENAAERIERLVRAVLRGRRLPIDPADAPDAGAIRVAAALAGARETYPRMSIRFRRRMIRHVAEAR
jgi:hypothetical protein